jgi:lysyl-tRNA synthetase class II
VTDAEARAYYDERRELYSGLRIRASHILVKDRATAEAVRAELAEMPGATGTTATLCGRLGQVRHFGKLRFAHLQDRTGSMQIGFQRERLPDFWPERKRIEGNDLVSITGELGTTQKGEPTLWATSVVLASKALRAAPEKWHGLTDTEQRYRMRYVDLFANP